MLHCESPCLLCCLLHSRAAFTNPADHVMDLITVKAPVTSEPSCPPVNPADMMPDPNELRAYYKNVQVALGAAVGVLEVLP